MASLLFMVNKERARSTGRKPHGEEGQTNHLPTEINERKWNNYLNTKTNKCLSLSLVGFIGVLNKKEGRQKKGKRGPTHWGYTVL